MRDPYKTLGVKRDAGADEIKSAWRSLAKVVHPDHNQSDPGASERFAELGRAYETLKDPKKRSRYDQVVRMAESTRQTSEQTIIQQRQAAREAAERAKVARANAEKVMEELARANAQRAAKAAAANAAAPNAAKATASAGAATNATVNAGATNAAGSSAGSVPHQETPEEVVERIFGSAARAAAPQAEQRPASAAAEGAGASEAEAAGETTEEELALAAGGISSIITQPFGILSSLVRRFTGTAPANTPDKAPDIAAEATITIADILQGNWISVTLSDAREVRFQAGPGMGNGHIVHLKGQGLKLQGMQRGDVAITLHLADDAQFKVTGFDIHTILPVTIENAVLGWQTEVEGPRGAVPVTVPAWSGSDRTIRIASQGLPDGQGGKGDLVVEVRLMLWDKPDDKMTDLMRSMKGGLFL